MRKVICLLAACLATTSLQAADITSPFYLPEKGSVLSTTAVGYDRVHIKNDLGKLKNREKALQQELTYGLSDKAALLLSAGNGWDKIKTVLPDGNTAQRSEPTNIRWSVGARYGLIQDDNLNAIMDLKFLQRETHYQKGAYKAFNADARIGYDIKNFFLPYVGGKAELPIAQSKYFDNDMKYGLYAGVYRNFCYNVSADVRFGLDYDKYFSRREWYSDAHLSYFLSKSTSIGLRWKQVLNEKAARKTKIYEYNYGADLRIEF